ncbi:MAG TPA: hypothetical protein VLY65_01180 [Nitrososphaerales archaeon]|nr:hypothetical protein [Nitrososphaerales archaeon]
MKKSEGVGTGDGVGDIAKSKEGAAPSSAVSFGMGSPIATVDGIIVLPLSKVVRLLLPPLFVSSLPRRAIGFSFPRGTEGKLLGTTLFAATVTLSYVMNLAFGVFAALAVVWLMGGTSLVMLYNSTSHGLAFVKEMCSTCRLRPIIEEHEKMHLNGEPSEEAVWREARKKYSYEGLGLGSDPKIHSFCPIAKRLKESP